MAKLTKLDDIVSLCKRRGFIFQSSEIYGGLASCYDYGPLGAELKRNVRNAWWKAVVQMRDDVVGLDCSILMHPMVWKASGHADKFADLVTVCKKCNTRTRVDHPRCNLARCLHSSDLTLIGVVYEHFHLLVNDLPPCSRTDSGGGSSAPGSIRETL